MTAVAVDLDALADTRPLWNAWLDSVESILGVPPAELPSDRGAAAAELDRRGAGNWRTMLERFAEDRAAAYLRRDAAVSAALRRLAADGHVVGVFTDAPEPLARVALAQLGASRRVASFEAGSDSLERLLESLGVEVAVVETRDALLAHAFERGQSDAHSYNRPDGAKRRR